MERAEGMSRQARMVITAVSKTPVYKTMGISEKAITKSAPAGLRKKKVSV